jgi:hypothetical protein
VRAAPLPVVVRIAAWRLACCAMMSVLGYRRES